jgi:SynChlorMet cassette protein ScmD
MIQVRSLKEGAILPLEKPLANPQVVLREEFDDWAVLFNPDNADAVGINPAGVVIWRLLDGAHTLDEIVAALREHFSEVSDHAAEEAADFIERLAEQGFVGYPLPK